MMADCRYVEKVMAKALYRGVITDSDIPSKSKEVVNCYHDEIYEKETERIATLNGKIGEVYKEKHAQKERKIKVEIKI